MPTVAQVNTVLGFLTIVANILTVAILGSLLLKTGKNILSFFAKNGLSFSFIVSLTGMLGSLFYSDVAKYDPCTLCWYQRILLYPQVFLYGLAIYKKDQRIVDYGLMLSVIGAVIAGYHYLLQRGVVPSIACNAVGYSVSCSQRFVLQYGYITIPVMALSAFLLIISMLLAMKYSKKD